MSLVVQKYGGTSIADIEKIKNIALNVQKLRQAGGKVVVVVSAMAGVTNTLVSYCTQLSSLASKDALIEYDTVLSNGENITSALLSLHLLELGIESRSYRGWQIPIITDDNHQNAHIEEINTEKLKADLAADKVVVISGFQGITRNNDISTLGRGGSDTTASAIAAALNANRCDIYTDVKGVYSSDPRIVKKAQKLKKLSYEEMLEFASSGAKVLHYRSVQIAMKYKVPLRVLSTFNLEDPGTLIVSEEEIMEKKDVTGIAHNHNVAMVTVRNVMHKPGAAAAIFKTLSDMNIAADMIVQNVTSDGQGTDLTFNVPLNEINRVKLALEEKKAHIFFKEVEYRTDVVMISVVGIGLKSSSDIPYRMFNCLANEGVNILVISTSDIKVSVLTPDDCTDKALKSLHSEFGLDVEV